MKLKDLIPKEYQHENHRKPVTRRDFLARGALASSSMLMVPTVLSLFKAKTVHAQESNPVCSNSSASSALPFICFDLAGGGNIAGSNVMVGVDKQDNFLNEAGYRPLGLPEAIAPNRVGTNNDYGLKFHPNSAMLDGMNQRAVSVNKNAVDGVLFAARSENDTQNNPHNPVYWISRAGATGSLTTLAGSSSSRSGGRSQPAAGSYDPTKRPTLIRSNADVLNLIDPGVLFQVLKSSEDLQTRRNIASVMKASERMSNLALDKFNHLSFKTQIQTLVDCGYLSGKDLLSRNWRDEIDLYGSHEDSQKVKNAFGLSRAGQGSTQATAAMVRMLLGGFAGAGTITLGGYDYHNVARGTTDGRDRVVGQLIGGTLEAAAQLGKSIMIYVFTDGAVGAGATVDTVNGVQKLRFSSDDASRSSTFALAYHHGASARPGTGGNRQVGNFNPTGSLNLSSSSVSNSVNELAKAVVANYMALNGNISQFDDVIGSRAGSFGGLGTDSVVRFKRIV